MCTSAVRACSRLCRGALPGVCRGPAVIQELLLAERGDVLPILAPADRRAAGRGQQAHAAAAEPGHGAAQGAESQSLRSDIGNLCSTPMIMINIACWAACSVGMMLAASWSLLHAANQHEVDSSNVCVPCVQLCCHPFLCDGLEEDIAARHAAARSGNPAMTELEQLVAASGKMVLLNKLLPKLRAEGHKVLGRPWRMRMLCRHGVIMRRISRSRPLTFVVF